MSFNLSLTTLDGITPFPPYHICEPYRCCGWQFLQIHSSCYVFYSMHTKLCSPLVDLWEIPSLRLLGTDYDSV